MSQKREQVLDRVDGGDRVVGRVLRQDVFREKANFRVAHLLLFNKHSQVLLQRLAFSRKRHPGRWGSSVAAYVSAGEEYSDAVLRRAKQELGVEIDSLTPLGTTRMEEQNGCSKFIGVFSANWDGEIRIDQSHISQMQFADPCEVLHKCQAEPSKFTPTFLHLAGRYLGSTA